MCAGLCMPSGLPQALSWQVGFYSAQHAATASCWHANTTQGCTAQQAPQLFCYRICLPRRAAFNKPSSVCTRDRILQHPHETVLQPEPMMLIFGPAVSPCKGRYCAYPAQLRLLPAVSPAAAAGGSCRTQARRRKSTAGSASSATQTGATRSRLGRSRPLHR